MPRARPVRMARTGRMALMDGDIAGIDAGTGIRIDDGGTTTPEVNIANNANLPGNPTTTTQATMATTARGSRRRRSSKI